MSSPVSRPPGSEAQERPVVPVMKKAGKIRKDILSFLVILGVIVVVLAALFLSTLPQIWQPVTAHIASSPLDNDSSVILSDKGGKQTPQIPGQLRILVEQKQGLSLLSASGGQRKNLSLPGYSYNQSVRPILLSSGQILYAGEGLWLTDSQQQASHRIFALSAQEVLTSLVVNESETSFAWSTAPAQGQGRIKIYAGTLDHFSVVYQQPAEECPCLRPFAFLHQVKTLLLSDDRGDHKPVYYGLWSLALDKAGSQPQTILSNSQGQGPLAFSPTSNTLLYAHAQGFVPAPTDGSVPDELASQSYANSLSLISLNTRISRVEREQDLMALQRQKSNSAEYHWVTTPSFSPRGESLLYVLFSSDSEQPYDRHNALYMVTFADPSSPKATSPQLLASSMADFIEIGPWINEHLVTLYADQSVYILDTQTNGFVKVGAVSGDYTRIIGVVQ